MLGEQAFNHLFPPPSRVEGVAVPIMHSRWRNSSKSLAKFGAREESEPEGGRGLRVPGSPSLSRGHSPGQPGE